MAFSSSTSKRKATRPKVLDTTSVDYVLKDLEHFLIKDGYFTADLYPYVEGKDNSKRIKLVCTLCNKDF